MPTKIIIPCRFSYAHVWEPTAMEEDQKKKYSVSLIVSKDDTVTVEKIKAAIAEAAEIGKAKLGGKIPANLKQPLRDGDLERPDDEAYQNSYYLSANSERKPGIVDADVQPIIDQDEFYSGCFGRASVNFYAFAVPANKGIAASLQNLQKLKDGERLSGGASAAEDFGSDDDMMA